MPVGQAMTARVLLSGGIDSALCLVLALRSNRDVEAVAIDYGQRHAVPELASAVLIAQVLSVPLSIVRGVSVASGALTGEEGDLDSSGAVIPGRNKALLRVAGWHGGRASEVWIGATADDFESFEDCRRGYFDALELEWGLAIRSPLVVKTKAEIVAMFHEHGASNLLPYTHSCYQGGRLACGFCGACRGRAQAFYSIGLKDPGAYENRALLSPCEFCGADPGVRCHHPSHGWTAPHKGRAE